MVVLSDPPAVHALLALGEDAAVKSRRYYSSLDQVGGAGLGREWEGRVGREWDESGTSTQGACGTVRQAVNPFGRCTVYKSHTLSCPLLKP